VRLGAWLVAAALTAALCALVSRRSVRADDRQGPWRLAVTRFRRNRGAMLALYVVLALVVVATLAPWLAPYDPTEQPDLVALKSRPPSVAHPLGTDPFSRDVLSRLLHGARVSLAVALMSVSLALTVATAYGAVAGYNGGRVDGAMMRLIDAALAVPRILLLIAVLALWGRVSLTLLVLLLGMTGWFGVSRLVRAQVMAAREQEWVQAARALGARGGRILLRHILPNSLAPVIVAASLGIGNVIIVEAGLSYLGLGVQPPTPSWGNMIGDGRDQIATLWWLSLFPGLAIVLTVMAFNVVGEGLRDALDPRQVHRS
jgi:peptide/nickel transport system permease protein